MNYSKLIDIYRKRVELNAPSWREAGLTLASSRIQSEDYNPDGRSLGPFANNCHMLWMLDEIENMELRHGCRVNGTTKYPLGVEEKLNRWIGFVQGVLWTQGMASIEDLRQDVIACK